MRAATVTRVAAAQCLNALSLRRWAKILDQRTKIYIRLPSVCHSRWLRHLKTKSFITTVDIGSVCLLGSKLMRLQNYVQAKEILCWLFWYLEETWCEGQCLLLFLHEQKDKWVPKEKLATNEDCALCPSWDHIIYYVPLVAQSQK